MRLLRLFDLDSSRLNPPSFVPTFVILGPTIFPLVTDSPVVNPNFGSLSLFSSGLLRSSFLEFPSPSFSIPSFSFGPAQSITYPSLNLFTLRQLFSTSCWDVRFLCRFVPGQKLEDARSPPDQKLSLQSVYILSLCHYSRANGRSLFGKLYSRPNVNFPAFFKTMKLAWKTENVSATALEPGSFSFTFTSEAEK